MSTSSPSTLINYSLPPELKDISNLTQTLSQSDKQIQVKSSPPLNPSSSTSSSTLSSSPSTSPQRFELKEMIGQGNYGEVWNAFDHKLKRTVAMKYFKGSVKERDEALHEETRLIQDLEHPGIPPIYDFNTETKDTYLIMKYIEGMSLDQIILKLQEGDPITHARYPFSQRIEIIIQLLRILAQAHKKGVLHRDIKPQNILLGEHGEVSLIDWGIAIKIHESSAQVGRVYGTPLYMSPEQCFQSQIGPTSDLFAVGAIAYEFLCLQKAAPPAESAFQVMMDLPEYQPKQLDYIMHPAQGAPPSDFTVAIMKSLSRDPSRRQQSAEEFMFSLQKSLNGHIEGVCPRTRIKGRLLRLTRWLDLNPFVHVPILYLSLFFTALTLIGLGVLLAHYFSL